MSLTLKGCLEEGCNTLSFIDTTGNYNVINNPGGYGAENGVAGPADFDSYNISFWDPTKDYYTDEPTVTINLQSAVPTQAEDGSYTWVFTAAQLGVTTVSDGFWYYEAVAKDTTYEYTVQGAVMVLYNLDQLMQAKALKWKPGCGTCKGGCDSISKLLMDFLVLKCGGTCDIEGAKKAITYLRNKVATCC